VRKVPQRISTSLISKEEMLVECDSMTELQLKERGKEMGDL